MEARIVDIGDASLSVHDAGSGQSIVFLHRIHAPALVMAGELDPAAPPATLKQLAEKLPNTTYLEFPGTGHYLNIEEPEAFTAAIIRFIEKHPSHR